MMLEVAFVSVRDTAEVLILLLALSTCLTRRRALMRMRGDPAGSMPPGLLLGIGALLGIVPGIVLPLALASGTDPTASALVDLAFGLFLVWMAAGVLTTDRRIAGSIAAMLDLWMDRIGGLLTAAGLAALVTFREVFELVYFASRRVDQLGWTSIGLAVASGMLGAVLIPLVAWRLRARLPLGTLFRLSGLVLAYFAIDMIVDSLLALGRLAILAGGHAGQGVGWLESLERPLTAVLMLLPIYAFVRDWWLETDSGRRGRRTG